METNQKPWKFQKKIFKKNFQNKISKKIFKKKISKKNFSKKKFQKKLKKKNPKKISKKKQFSKKKNSKTIFPKKSDDFSLQTNRQTLIIIYISPSSHSSPSPWHAVMHYPNDHAQQTRRPIKQLHLYSSCAVGGARRFVIFRNYILYIIHWTSTLRLDQICLL